jgi:hypothetical protein
MSPISPATPSASRAYADGAFAVAGRPKLAGEVANAFG